MRTLALTIALASVSCHSLQGTGPSISSIRQNLDHVALVPTDPDAEPPRPTSEAPLRLAILPPLSVEPRGNGVPPQAFDSWTDEEMDALTKWADRAKAAGLVESVQFVPGFLVDDSEVGVLAGAQRAGLTLGADAVLITRLGTTYELDPTALSLLDVAIVPAFVVPAAEFRATAIVEGAVLDVRSGYAYATGTSEARFERHAPSLTGDVSRYRAKARLAGVDQMTSRMLAPLGVEDPTVQE